MLKSNKNRKKKKVSVCLCVFKTPKCNLVFLYLYLYIPVCSLDSQTSSLCLLCSHTELQVCVSRGGPLPLISIHRHGLSLEPTRGKLQSLSCGCFSQEESELFACWCGCVFLQRVVNIRRFAFFFLRRVPESV